MTRQIPWLRVFVEGVVIVGSILLVFGIDAWWEGNQDSQLEDRYLERLATDLDSDTAEIRTVVARTDQRLSQLRLLADAIADPHIAGDHPADFVHAIEQVTWRSVPTITTYTYDELLSTGRMALLRSEDLRNGLAEYYAFLADQRWLGLGEDDPEPVNDNGTLYGIN